MIRRVAFTKIEFVVVFAIIVVCAGLLDFWAPLQALAWLAIGWVLHSIRVARGLVFDGDATLTALIAIILFIAGLHLLARTWRGRSLPTEAARPWSWRWTFCLTALVVCVAAAGIAAVGIAHQSVWLATTPKWLESGSIRIVAGRTQSQNNLKQLALGALEHHERRGGLPPGATFAADAQPMHSWPTFLLPYVEQNEIAKMVRLDLPWTAPANQEAFKRDVPIYMNPSISETKQGPLAPSHYAANVHVLGAGARRLADITDGAANTILFGEAAGQFKAWGQPLNWRDPAHGINRSPDGFGNPALAGASFVFADGSVRFLKESINPDVLKALATPAGGEPMSPLDWD